MLTTNWLAVESSKQTTLEYPGDRQLRLDHTSLTVTVVERGSVTGHAGYAGTISRKQAHYEGLYDALLADRDDVRLGVGLARDIAELLEEAAAAASGAVGWSLV